MKALSSLLLSLFVVQVVSLTCPASPSASQCFVGATGPSAAISAMGSYPPINMFIGGSSNICMSYTMTCAVMIASGTTGINSTNCPSGQSVTTYSTVPASSCSSTVAAISVANSGYSNSNVCGTNNCNAPAGATVIPYVTCPTGATVSCLNTLPSGSSVTVPAAADSICFSVTFTCTSTFVVPGFCTQSQVGKVVTDLGMLTGSAQSGTALSQCQSLQSSLALLGWTGGGVVMCASNNCNAPSSSSPANIIKPAAGIIAATAAAMFI